MTTQQIIASLFVVTGVGILGMVLWGGSDLSGVTKASGAGALGATLPGNVATDPLVPALAAQVPGDPFVQRMVGQRRGTSIPLPPPPPVLTPEPPLLPLIGH